MRKIFLALCCILCTGSCFSQAIDTVNIYTFGGLQNDGCMQVKPTADGGYITIGTTNSFGHGNTDFYAIKTDSNCKRIWSNAYGGVGNEEGFGVTQTFDKGYAFVGFTDTYGYGGYDVYLVKTDSSGNMLWQQTYGGSDWDFGYAIQQLPDSGFVICGQTYSFGKGNGDVYIIRTKSNGDTVWTRTVGDTGCDVGNAIYVQGDSLLNIVGASTSYNSFGDTNGILIQMYLNGIVKHTNVYYSLHNTTFSSITTNGDTGFFMYGRTDSLPDSLANQVTSESELITDKNGKLQLMLINYTPPKAPFATGIGSDAEILPDSTFLSLGSNNGVGAGGFDFHTQHLKPGGYGLSENSYGSSGDELAGSMALGKNGDIVLGGSTDSPDWTEGLFDVCLVLLKKDSAFSLFPDYLKVHNYLDTLSLTEATVANISGEQLGVKVFPNPVNTQATVLLQGRGLSATYTMNLYNEAGQLVESGVRFYPEAHGQSIAIIQRGNLAAGEYIYDIYTQNNNKVAEGKIVFE